MSRAGRRVIDSAKEALAFAERRSQRKAYAVHVPRDVDVRAVRRKMGMSQEVFAAHFGVSVRTVQDWEQGQRAPSGPARAFLTVIDREPEAVKRALIEAQRLRNGLAG